MKCEIRYKKGDNKTRNLILTAPSVVNIMKQFHREVKGSNTIKIMDIVPLD